MLKWCYPQAVGTMHRRAVDVLRCVPPSPRNNDLIILVLHIEIQLEPRTQANEACLHLCGKRASRRVCPAQRPEVLGIQPHSVFWCGCDSQPRPGPSGLRLHQFLTDGSLSVEGDGHASAPWGFAGGAPGHPSSLDLIRGSEKLRALPSMLPTISVRKGDKVRAVGGIGGGYGDPLERAEQLVLNDVLDGYLTREQAAVDFGVVITHDAKLDMEATRRKRQVAREGNARVTGRG